MLSLSSVHFTLSPFHDSAALSATTLASENVPILYTSSCYCVKKKLASNMKLELESGMLRTYPFPNKPCHKWMFHCTGIRRQEMRFGDMEYGTVYDGSVVALFVSNSSGSPTTPANYQLVIRQLVS